MPVQITLPDDLVADIRRGSNGVVEQLRTLLAEPELAVWRISRESTGFDTMNFTHNADGVSAEVSFTESVWGSRLSVGQVLVIPYNDTDTLFRVMSIDQSIGREFYPSTVVIRAESTNGRTLVVASGDTIIHRDEPAPLEVQDEPLEDEVTEDGVLMGLFEHGDDNALTPPIRKEPEPEPEPEAPKVGGSFWRRMRLV